MKCPKCHFENPDDTLYCGKCASQLKSSYDISPTKTLETPAKGLTTGTTYYVRTFATTATGTSYGNQTTFTTL